VSEYYVHRHSKRIRLPKDPFEKRSAAARQTPDQLLARLAEAMARLEKSVLRRPHHR
jgi:hypothetical protein